MSTLLKHNELWRLKYDGDTAMWTVQETPRDMPCEYWKPPDSKHGKGTWVPCQTRVRVKIKEPGIYARLCPKCEQTTYYILSPLTELPGRSGVLSFRWIAHDAAERIMTEERSDLDESFDLTSLLMVPDVPDPTV